MVDVDVVIVVKCVVLRVVSVAAVLKSVVDGVTVLVNGVVDGLRLW